MWKKRQVELYSEIFNEQLVKSVADMGKLYDYEEAWNELDELQRKYPGHEIFDATRADKQRWNKLSTAVSTFELLSEGTPIFNEMKKRYEEEGTLPEFLQEGKPMSMEVAGWYQNLRGELYHYNGMVWDRGSVPGRSEELEFLGGK